MPFNTVFAAGEDPKLVEELQQAGVQYSFLPPPNPIGGFLLTLLLPVLLLGGFWYCNLTPNEPGRRRHISMWARARQPR